MHARGLWWWLTCLISLSGCFDFYEIMLLSETCCFLPEVMLSCCINIGCLLVLMLHNTFQCHAVAWCCLWCVMMMNVCCLAAYALLIENLRPVQKSTWIMSCLTCVMMLMLCHWVLLLDFGLMRMKHELVLCCTETMLLVIKPYYVQKNSHA